MVTNSELRITLVFVTSAVLFIASLSLKPYVASWLVKVLPILCLIAWSLPKVSGLKEKVFIAGLCSSLVGDVLLDYAPEQGFIFGLAAFFIAHLFYIFSFAPSKLSEHLWHIVEKRPFKFLLILVYLIAALLVFWLLSPNLAELTIPVLAYMLVLVLMAVAANVSDNSNFWLVLGASSFLLSDALLGINKFYQPLPYANVWIMISYYFAQFTLTKGYFLRPKQVS